MLAPKVEIQIIKEMVTKEAIRSCHIKTSMIIKELTTSHSTSMITTSMTTTSMMAKTKEEPDNISQNPLITMLVVEVITVIRIRLAEDIININLKIPSNHNRKRTTGKVIGQPTSRWVIQASTSLPTHHLLLQEHQLLQHLDSN